MSINRYARGVAVPKNGNMRLLNGCCDFPFPIFHMWRSAFSDDTLIPLHAFHKRFCPYVSQLVAPKKLWNFIQSLYNGTCGNYPALFEITSKLATFRLCNRPISLNLTTLISITIILYFIFLSAIKTRTIYKGNYKPKSILFSIIIFLIV